MVNQPIIANDAEFSARLLSNPIGDELKFNVTVNAQQQARIMITSISGRILVNDQKLLSHGVNNFTYSASNWAKGLYLINVNTTNNYHTTLKALK